MQAREVEETDEAYLDILMDLNTCFDHLDYEGESYTQEF